MPELRPDPPMRDIKADAALEDAELAPEEVSNKAHGHKANLHNPRTSEESKKHSEQVYKELGGEEAFYSKSGK